MKNEVSVLFVCCVSSAIYKGYWVHGGFGGCEGAGRLAVTPLAVFRSDRHETNTPGPHIDGFPSTLNESTGHRLLNVLPVGVTGNLYVHSASTLYFTRMVTGEVINQLKIHRRKQ